MDYSPQSASSCIRELWMYEEEREKGKGVKRLRRREMEAWMSARPPQSAVHEDLKYKTSIALSGNLSFRPKRLLNKRTSAALMAKAKCTGNDKLKHYAFPSFLLTSWWWNHTLLIFIFALGNIRSTELDRDTLLWLPTSLGVGVGVCVWVPACACEQMEIHFKTKYWSFRKKCN